MFGAAENGLRRLLGPLELRIMEAVWAAGQPVAIRDICDQLAHEASPPAFTTVMTVMNRLVEKEFLLRSGSRKSYLFAAKASKAELQARLSQQMVAEVLSDYGPLAINHFVEAVANDPGKLSLLESLLGRRKRKEESS